MGTISVRQNQGPGRSDSKNRKDWRDEEIGQRRNPNRQLAEPAKPVGNESGFLHDKKTGNTGDSMEGMEKEFVTLRYFYYSL